jgi:ribosome-associated toxin RatA of RatAB toxin-antitoxin module
MKLHAPSTTSFETTIRADVSTVYMLVAELELWPALIPHIRSARVIQRMGDRRLVSVRASWRGVPVGWRAIQLREPGSGRVTFRHLMPVSRGTTVTWTVRQIDAETVSLSVEQRLKLASFVPARPLVTELLARGVGPELANLMLLRFKYIAEGGSLAGRE